LSGTDVKVISETESDQFLSEKSLERGGVTVVTSTSASGFAAKNLSLCGRKVILS